MGSILAIIVLVELLVGGGIVIIGIIISFWVVMFVFLFVFDFR